jgi:gamma-glutamyl phosphate reductase
MDPKYASARSHAALKSATRRPCEWVATSDRAAVGKLITMTQFVDVIVTRYR